ncbi:MAG: hypothetical protein ACKVQA_24005 [Burkholderiales bacterium]
MRRVAAQDKVWVAVVLLCLLLPFLPIQLESNLKLASWLSGYPGEVAERFYSLLKTAILALPVGFAFAVAGRELSLKLCALVVTLISVPVALVLPQFKEWNALEPLLMLPGLGLGIWLGQMTQQVPQVAVGPAGQFTKAAPQDPKLRPRENIGEVPSPARKQHSEVAHQPISSIVLAALIAGIVAISLWTFPRWALPLGLGYAVYAAVLWRWPQAWLLSVPAALPLFDLAPWTGRFYFDEFDRLILVTIAVLSCRLASVASISGLRHVNLLFLLVLGFSVLVSTVIGLVPLPAIDINAFVSYLSPYNALRILKGFLWGAAVFWLYRRTPGDRLELLAKGTALGLLGASLVSMWEVWLFGATHGNTDYRVTATFSSMHTGGGHIEAYMAFALPLVAGLMIISKNIGVRVVALIIVLTGAYAMTTTVARGGILGLAMGMGILAIGGVRAASKLQRVSHAILFMVIGAMGIGGLVWTGMSGSFFQQRWSQLSADVQTRTTHWRDALSMQEGNWVANVMGMGLGSFPRTYYLNHLDRQLGSYSFNSSGENVYLSLNSGGDLYEAQMVSVEPNQPYTFALDVLSDGKSERLEASLCEKKLFNSFRCEWLAMTFPPGEKSWQKREVTFNSREVGAGNWWSRRPVQLSLYNPAAGTTVHTDNIRLLDREGNNLISNGDFSQGGDHWFFKSGDHLPWHIKNLWVHLLFEHGWLGLVLFATLALVAVSRLSRALWHGNMQSTMLLSALAGLLTVGVVDSLLDAPRVAILLVFALMAGAWGGSVAPTDPGRLRRPNESRPRWLR